MGFTHLTLLAVLGAALGHAVWNAIAHRITDKTVGFTLVGLGSAVCCVPLLLTRPFPAPAIWPYLLGSLTVHTGYLVMLMQAYRLGDYGHAYPLARGTAPLAVTGLAAAFAGERPSPATLAGVGVVSAGLTLLIFSGARLTRKDLPASAAAVSTGLLIAGYTIVDGLGVRASHDSLAYTAWLMLMVSLTVPSAALLRRRRRLWRQLRPVWGIGLIGGAISLGAYGLVLWAQVRTPLAAVSAVRETSVIMGAVIGTVLFHERFGLVRVSAAALVTAGIVVIELT